MNRDSLVRIIEAGALAPSGSNSQPWEFVVEGDVIFIVAHPERDHPILNVHHRGTWIAIGAAIQNMVIAAAVEGFTSQVAYFPQGHKESYAASLRLTQGLSIADLPVLTRFHSAIPLRTTNRKPYDGMPLSPEALHDFDSIQSVRWITDPARIVETGRASAKAEQLMLENAALHRQLFHEIVWNRDEEREHGGGLLVDTMELEPPQQFSFKHIFSKRPLMWLLNLLGAARMVARDNGRIYGTSTRMGVITVPRSAGASEYFSAGRVLERLWLIATHHHVSFHIIGGIIFLYESLRSGNPAQFSSAHTAIVTDAYATIAKNAQVRDDEDMAILFRIGRSEPPRARSAKNVPRITWR